MSFLTGKPLGINKHAVMSYYESKLDIFASQELKDPEEAKRFMARYKLEKEAKHGELIEAFGNKILSRAKKYTPYQSDEKHNKEHPTEKHLRDAYETKLLFNAFGEYGQSFLITNNNSYASAVHEDTESRHEYPTMNTFLMYAAAEVSAEYDNPFNIYIKISNDGLGLYITDESDSNIDKDTDDTYKLEQETVTEKYTEIWSKKEIPESEVRALKKMDPSILANNYALKREVKQEVIPGFKKLISGTGIDKSFNRHIKEEQDIRNRLEQIDDEDDYFFD